MEVSLAVGLGEFFEAVVCDVSAVLAGSLDVEFVVVGEYEHSGVVHDGVAYDLFLGAVGFPVFGLDVLGCVVDP